MALNVILRRVFLRIRKINQFLILVTQVALIALHHVVQYSVNDNEDKEYDDEINYIEDFPKEYVTFQLDCYQDSGDTKTGMYGCSKCENSFKDLELLSEHKNAQHLKLRFNKDADLDLKNSSALKNTKDEFERMLNYLPVHKQSSDEQIKDEGDSDDERDSEGLSHNKRIMNEKPQMYECSLCRKSFRNLKLLSTHKNDQHLKQKRESQTKSTKCEECDKIFHSVHTLNAHIVVFHTKEYPHFCDSCAKGFIQKHRFERHREVCISTELTESVFRPRKRRIPDGQKTKLERICDKCGKSFENISAMKRHILHHTKSQNYQCDDCGKAYADKRNLKNHVEKEHPMSTSKFEREKNVPCDLCRQLFTMKTEVEHHKVNDHNHSYFIKCDVCGKGFIKKDYIKKLENHKKKCVRKPQV